MCSVKEEKLLFLYSLCLTARSLQEFAGVLQNLEDERTRMVSEPRSLSSSAEFWRTNGIFFCLQIDNANDVLITPLERFRKEQIGAAKVRNLLI